MRQLKFLTLAAFLALPLVACDEGTNVDLQEGTIRGSVSIEGTGQAGVTVALSTGASTTTGASGSYQFDAVPAGSYTVTISGFPADATFPATAKTATLASAGQVATVDFDGTFIRTSSIVGAVVATNPGAAPAPGADGPAAVPGGIAGVTVNLSGPNGSATTQTDAGGQFSFTGIRQGTYTVEIGGFDTNKYNFASTSTTVTVAVGQTAVVSAFENGTEASTSTLTTNVTRDGNALAGVNVSIQGPANRSLVTGSNGQAVFTGLPRGTYIVSISGFDAANIQFPNVSQNVTIAEIGGSGSVTFTGSTITGASVDGRVFADMNRNGAFDSGVDQPFASLDVTLNGPTGTVTGQTGADGSYQFPGLPSGTYTVSIINPNSDAWIFDRTSASVTLTATQNATVNFRAIERRDGVIRGRVWFDGGDGVFTAGQGDVPAANFTVSIDGPGGVKTVTTDANGEYRFPNLLLGDYDVSCNTCNATFAPTSPVAVTLSDASPRVTVDYISGGGTGSVSGSLYIDGNENDVLDFTVDGDHDVAGVVVTLEGPSVGQFRTTTTDANGDYLFTDLSPGLYNVSISGADPALVAFPATIGTSNPVPFTLVNGMPAFVNFGFDIQIFTIKVPVAYGADGSNQKPAKDVTVTIYANQPLTVPLGTGVTAADGFATIQFTRAAETSVPGAADFIAFSNVTTAGIDPDAVILSDPTIEFDINKNVFMQTLGEDHDLLWARVFMRAKYVEQDGTPVSDATLAGIVAQSPAGPPIPDLRMRLGFGQLTDLSDRTETANVDFPHDLQRNGFGGVQPQPTEAVGEVTFYVAIPRGGQPLPQFFSAEEKSPSAQVTKKGNVTNKPAFVGTFVDGSERNVYLGDMVISYPLPDIKARIWHETNDVAGYQVDATGVDGTIDDFINTPSAHTITAIRKKGTTTTTVACTADGIGNITCLDVPSDATSWELKTVTANINTRYLTDGGITFPVTRNATTGQDATADISSRISNLRFSQNLGNEPFSYKFEGNTLRFFVFNETGPGIDGDGVRDGTVEMSVAGVNVHVAATKSLGMFTSEFPKTGSTRDAPPTEGGVFSITPTGTDHIGMFEGEYQLTVTGVGAPFTGTVDDLRIVQYDPITGAWSSFMAPTSVVKNFDIQRTTPTADVKVAEVEGQFRGGTISGFTFNNDDDDLEIDPNEVVANIGVTVTANDPVRQLTTGTTCADIGAVSGSSPLSFSTVSVAGGSYTVSSLWEGCYSASAQATAPTTTRPTSRGLYGITEANANGGTTSFPGGALTFNLLADASDTDFELIFSNGTITLTVLDNVTSAPLQNILVRFSSCRLGPPDPGAPVGSLTVEGNALTGGFCDNEIVLTPINDRTNASGQITFTGLMEGFYQVDPVENSYNAGSLPVEDKEIIRILATGTGQPDSEARTIRIIP